MLVQSAYVDGLRVAVVDDEPIARSRLSRLLSVVGGPSIEVVLQCGTAHEFLALGPTAMLDVAFVDIEMPGGDGLDAVTGWTAAQRPQMVIVTAHHEHALRAFDARAIDYLTKPVLEGRLREALDRAYAYRPSTHQLPKSTALPDICLTSRQVQMLQLLSKRRSNKEIGRALELSHFTVRNQLSALYRLFGVDRRHDLLVRAAATGALETIPAPASNNGLQNSGFSQN